ncbi:MAG: carboxypeptidase regulatory-like domain-containing protein [Myxococcaceae bacterium]|nr:carboxypeptidase regulatory-like domain-containing protein [Myxococcaceae bacterium]
MTRFRVLSACVALCSFSVLAAPPRDCPGPKTDKTVAAATPERGDPKARESAQRGLEFLVREATAWQNTNKCYGCHVHSVTLEALSVGIHNQYDLSRTALDTLLEGMTKLSGGSRTPDGLSYQHSSLLQPSRAFGGAAFARYDAFVGTKVRDDLIKVAGQLLAYQAKDGHLDVQYQNGVVARGDVQATYHAIVTWKQAYAASADVKWLAPVQRAEGWLQKQKPTETSNIAYVVMGLTAAGVGPTEAPMPSLTRQLLERQQRDGGFGDALTTGQVLYALRLVGFTDRDKQVSLGTGYLVSHQQKGGGWGGGGFGKAEAMWAVLGLVSVDVMTVAISGMNDGEHVAEQQALDVEARDNQGDGVQRVELFIDDAKVAEACGPKVSHTWDTRSLGTGKHVVVAIATSHKGQKSQRQLEVFSGNVWLTQVGTDSNGESTNVTARNLTPQGKKFSVQMNISTVEQKDGKPVAGKVVFTAPAASEGGALKAEWNGKDKAGKVQSRGRYFAELVYRDEAGNEVQREQVLFNHDTAEAEAQKYGQVYGQLELKGGARGAAAAGNAQVELVNDRGEVVQSVVSTEQGAYRFKNVDTGKYKVRVKKSGYDFDDVPVAASPAKAAEASGALNAK